MDILYTLGNGSEYDNIELRWSLRSLEKYGKNVDRVIVSGIPPDWLSDEVVKFNVMPTSGIINKNIFKNVSTAVEQGVVSGDFILSADDHFYMRDIDFNDFPLYTMGELPSTISMRENHIEYKMGLVFSRWMLSSSGLPTYMTSNHNSIPVSSDSFSRYPDIVNASLSREYRTNTWALLGNMLLGVHPNWRRVQRAYDIKICDPLENRKDIINEIGNEHCFSIGENALESEEMIRFLGETFSKKSKWEK